MADLNKTNLSDFDIYSLIGADWLPQAGASQKYPFAVTSLSDSAAVIASYCAMKRDNKKGIFVMDNNSDILKISSLFCALFGREQVVLPECEFSFDSADALSGTADRARSAALEKISSGEYDVVITTADALCMPLPRPKGVSTEMPVLSIGDDADIDKICAYLAENGYSMFDMVEGEGSFSKRGGILDVFVPGQRRPVRIEFFGDSIERISYFDVISQRREDECPQIKLIGNRSAAYQNPSELLQILQKEYEKTGHKDILRDIELLSSGLKIAADKYIPLVYPKIFTLFDYVDASLLFVCEYANLKKRYEFIDWQFNENVEQSISHGRFICKDGGYYLSLAELEKHFDGRTFLLSRLSVNYSFKLSALAEADINESVVPSLDGGEAVDEILSFVEKGYRCIVTVRDGEREAAVKKLLTERDAPVSVGKVVPGAVCIVQSAVSVGIAFNASKILLVADAAVKKRAVRARRRGEGEKIKSFSDITPGDLVVHHAHGIGVYRGIKQMTVDGVTKDYIAIEFDKGDMLYVPCPQLDLISKYIGADPARVKLSRMGSPAWEKAKSKVRDESRELARELIELYARRLNTQGFAFSPDSEWQKEFEERFEYEETQDQLECTREIKADMERPYPMDRLLCGDVGVGKTEVALRAAFKAVSDSKQVAVLVPTTILASQHFNTIVRRFHGFPVKVAVLSRFKNRKEQQETVKAIKNGEVDIVVGTHRLLQKDIAFHDLGLLIVDEEQRFGVKHKEKIKELAIGVDVLTMSATPIPRTLNMAMSGIRDISIIEEAPLDRLPVMTYVLEYNFDIVQQAILREMRRSGCTFYLTNNIEALDVIAARITAAIPGARVLVVHGQMSPTEIENAWEQVMTHGVDVLLCTTIIETGIDVSFANTLIIEDADCMGLAQLHQIRGRIGRSSRRAYAYLTYRRDKTPSEVAAKRLVTIKEFTEFGAGLKIAMRDLEIRGAGSLLGEKQHGSMNVVGYDTYMEILKSVILSEQGIQEKKKTDCAVDVSISAYIPENYITSERTRIDIYKKIAAVEDEGDFEDTLDELSDRFSPPPESVINLMRISLIRNLARGLGVTEVRQKTHNLVFFFEQLSPDAVNSLSEIYKGEMLFTAGEKPYITLRPRDGVPVIDRMEQFLKNLKSFIS